MWIVAIRRRILLAFSSTFLVFVLAICLVVVLNTNLIDRFRQSDGVEKSYFATEFNPNSNQLLRYSTRFSSEVPENSFFSFYKNDGSYVTITNFKSSEWKYDCYVDCSCQGDSDEFEGGRRIAAAITRSLYVAVSAISTAFAVKLAKPYLDNLCEETRVADCVSSQSYKGGKHGKRKKYKKKYKELSDFDDVEEYYDEEIEQVLVDPIPNGGNIFCEKAESVGKLDDVIFKEDELKSWICTGVCTSYEKKKHKKYRDKISRSDLATDRALCESFRLKEKIEAPVEHVAQVHFLTQSLEAFCEKKQHQSSIEYHSYQCKAHVASIKCIEELFKVIRYSPK